MRWSRRAFMWWGLGAGVATMGAWRWWRNDPADLIVAILERHVGYLRVDPATFRTFAGTYLQAYKVHHSRLAMATVMGRPLLWARPDQWGGPVGKAFLRLDDSVVSRYLLSTDFFDHGADETRVVSYLGFYDPHSQACRSPFARQTGSES